MKKDLLHAQINFRKWKIKINENKTQAIIFPFNKSTRIIPSIPLPVDGAEIPFLNTIKYLGIGLNKKLTFIHQMWKRSVPIRHT